MPGKKTTSEQEHLVREYYAGGFSGSEISSKTGLSLKQIYSALHRMRVSMRSCSEQNRVRFQKKPLSFNFKEDLLPTEKELLVAGIMLYYGEGAKTGHTVDFANGDVRLLKVFLKFLREICRVDAERLRFYLYCFSSKNSEQLIRFWCSQLSVEPRQFTKPYVRSTLNRGNRTLANGVLHIRYSDKRLLEKVLSIGQELMSTL